MQLRELAHTRTGDKGNRSTLTVIAYRKEDFARLHTQLTAERVRAHYDGIVKGRVERFALPQLGALQFVLHDALAGGVDAVGVGGGQHKPHIQRVFAPVVVGDFRQRVDAFGDFGKAFFRRGQRGQDRKSVV